MIANEPSVDERPARWGHERQGALALALLFAVLVALFLRPILLPASGQAAGGADVRGLFLPWLAQARHALLQGRLPLWDAYQFAGYPFLANPQVAFFYPPTWLAWVLPLETAISWHMALHVWLLGVGMLLLMRRVGATWSGAFLSAIGLAFSGFVAARVYAGHMGLLATMAWLPWLWLALHWAVHSGHEENGATPAKGAIAGIPFGLAILAGHITSLYVVGLAWTAFALYLAFDSRSLLPLRQLALAMVVGAMLSAVQLLPTMQFALMSSRTAGASFEFASDYSFPPAHLITLFIPDFFGEPTRQGYWSVPVFEEYVYYAGVLALPALVLALRSAGDRNARRLAWFLAGLMALGLALALGRYSFFFTWLYDWFLPLRLARAPARFAFLYTFTASALLGLALTRWPLADHKEDLARTLRWLLAIGLIAGVAALAATGAVFASQHPSETSGRLWHQVGGWAWFLVMFVASVGLLWHYLGRRGAEGEGRGRNVALSGALLVLLLTVDLWHTGSGLIRLEPARAGEGFWRAAAQVAGETESRVLPWAVPIFEQNGARQVGLRSVFGYNAMTVGRMQALATSVSDPRSTAYDLLSAAYVVAPVELEQFSDGEGGLQLIDDRGGAWVYRRPRALPPVRLAYDVEVIAGADQAIARVHQPDFSAKDTVILDAEPPCDVAQGDASGEAHLLAHEDTLWRIATESAQPGILVVSESAYPGWQVTVDGERAQPLLAYTALRAVCVPAGSHIVEWTFHPRIYWPGAMVSVLGWGVVGWVCWKRRKRLAIRQLEVDNRNQLPVSDL